MSEHLTLDELAELDEGLLTGRRARAAQRHVGECDECSSLAEALRKTQASLRDLGPVQMPAEVSARLDRALRDAGSTSAEDVVPDLATVRARRFAGLPPWAYAAAAAVVVLAGVGIGIGTAHHHHNSVESAGPAKAPLVPTTTASPHFVQEESGQTYTPSTLAQTAPGLAFGAAGSDQLGVASGPNSAALPGSTASGGGTATNGHGQRNPPVVRPPAPLAPETAGVIAPSLQRLARSQRALLQCASFITDTANAAPLAVDFGRWTNPKAHLRGAPAVIFVFADTSDSSSIDVYVVAAACDANSLLDFQVLKKQ